MADPGRPDFEVAAIRQAKQLLRHAVLLTRESRTAETRAAADSARFQQLRTAVQSHPGRLRTVAAYLSTGTEPGTRELVGWLAAQDVRVLLPAIGLGPPSTERLRPDWAAYAGPERLRLGRFSILEPTTPRLGSAALSEADLVLCAGLAATPGGDRLGRGGGWYDRALTVAGAEAPVWVLLNDEEVLSSVPTDPWDRAVDAVVTPTRLLASSPDRRHRPADRSS